MEISVGNSGGSKTKSLDLKTLYKSEVSNKGESVKKETGIWVGNGEGTETKKRKSRKEVSISSFEDLAERKRIKHSIDDDIEVDSCSSEAQSSGVGQKINGGGVVIPKRPRGTVARSKSHLDLLKASDCVEIVTKLKDEPNEDEIDEQQIVNLNDESDRTNQKGMEGEDLLTSSLHENNGGGDFVKRTSSSNEEGSRFLKKEIEEEIPQGKSLSSNSTCADKTMGGVSVKRKGIDGKQKEDLNKKDKRNRRKRKYLGSGTCDLDPEDDLEQNAARMLSSRFDPSCIGFASVSHVNEEEKTDADRVLRPRRRQQKGYSRKRRHFYEIHSDDMDAHWFLNRRIKIFWPLDESWYYGLVNDYDAEKNLHHIKYDDRDEEWISLENERFKLLLLPNEVPHNKDIKDEMESEPIISWLAHRPTLKKQKQSHFNMRETDNCTCVSLNASSEGHVPIVYVRRRNRRFSDASCVPFIAWSLNSSGGSNKFEICISLWPMLTYVLGADTLWLFSRVLLLRFGTMVTLWPSVFLEVLFVDNVVGLRLFLFQGCLKQAVTFVFLVMKVFSGPQKDEFLDQQVPVTSVRFKLSYLQNLKVFAYYSFSKVRDCNWQYLDSVFQPHCLLTKQLSLSECTYDNVKLLEAGSQVAGQTAYFEVLHKKSNPVRPSTIYSLKNGNLPPFALSFSSAPSFFLSLHLKLLLERSITSLCLEDHEHDDEISSETFSLTQLVVDPICNVNKPALKGISVEIPTCDDVYMDCQKGDDNDDITTTTPRSLGDGKTDFIGNGFGNGPKKPRTQVQYTLPFNNNNIKNKQHPYQRIRKANEKKTTTSDPSCSSSKPPRRNLELVACDANILINGGDKGWRETGARVFLEVADQNEWKLAVKSNGGVLKYAYKVHQDLQPGSTNRYTHAMMWKGGKDWALEFPDRSQWVVFKELHEECHNRNIRAASIKNIPIPGVRLIQDSVDAQQEMGFLRSSWYYRQVRNDVEMAMDGSRVMYDMDSEDEEWLSREGEMMNDDVFEKVMDMLEKLSYAQKRDYFTCGEVEELVARVSNMQVAKTIYDHWREKRQRKGMPLIRQLQPPLWERYQQICREWDQSHPQAPPPKLTASGSHSQEKASAGDDKPPMFAFCLKPRGLELLNKGSKHRPHKKISLSGHSHAFLGDHDTHHSSGRRVNTYVFGEDRAESSDVSPLLSRIYSPRDASGPPSHFSLDNDASDWNHQRNTNSKKTIKPLISPRPSSTFRKATKRNNGKKPDWHNPPYRHPGQLLLGGSDLDEFRLRDASSAAKHARNMAKLKRERAQKLMLSADLAIHKAVSALMTAEAIKAMMNDNK